MVKHGATECQKHGPVSSSLSEEVLSLMNWKNIHGIGAFTKPMAASSRKLQLCRDFAHAQGLLFFWTVLDFPTQFSWAQTISLPAYSTYSLHWYPDISAHAEPPFHWGIWQACVKHSGWKSLWSKKWKQCNAFFFFSPSFSFLLCCMDGMSITWSMNDFLADALKFECKNDTLESSKILVVSPTSSTFSKRLQFRPQTCCCTSGLPL